MEQCSDCLFQPVCSPPSEEETLEDEDSEGDGNEEHGAQAQQSVGSHCLPSPLSSSKYLSNSTAPGTSSQWTVVCCVETQ